MYYRKSYELKKEDALQVGSYYFPAEESYSKTYIYDKIVDSTVDAFQKLNEKTKYKI